MDKDAKNIFTPNTTKGGRLRYVLYRGNPGYFSIVPGGRQYPFTSVPDACGLGCFCGAIITRTTAAGESALERAEQIDEMSETIERA